MRGTSPTSAPDGDQRSELDKPEFHNNLEDISSSKLNE